MSNHIPKRPDFDYANLPYLAREGIQANGNGKFLTRSLFLETCDPENYPGVLWCLSEHEVFCPAEDRWIPSAWMTYIYATDEYDALRKICGNVRQWEAIKKMSLNSRDKKMEDVLNDWRMEQAYVQKQAIKDTLLRGAISGAPGYTAAAKMLLQLIDGPGRIGAPKKAKDTKPQEAREAGADADEKRLLALVPRA